MTDTYLFERGIGQQMGDLCRLAVGDAKVTQTGEIVTLEDMLGRGAFGVSVEVPYTEGGVQSVSVTRCGKNLLAPLLDNWKPYLTEDGYKQYRFKYPANLRVTMAVNAYTIKDRISILNATHPVNANVRTGIILENSNWGNNKTVKLDRDGYLYVGTYHPVEHLQLVMNRNNIQVELGTTPTAYKPYNGETHTISLPADFYGGTVNLEAGTVTSRYAADGTELAEPVVTEIDPIAIPILMGVNNIWADVGTVTVSYYPADTQGYRPALWYPTIYRGLTSARYLIKRASGAIASFSDGIAAPLVGLRVALPYDAEGYQSVSVTVNGTLTTITLPANFYGGYLDVVTGQLIATHDEKGNLLANQKLYFLPPTNINALAGVNNVRSDAGDVAVSYRIDNG